MDGHELKMARKKAMLSQRDAAKRAGVDMRTWQRWEVDDAPIPAYVEKVIAEAIEVRGGNAGPDTVPEDDAGRIAYAIQKVQRYLVTFESLPAKLGKNTPYAFALDFWNAGVMRWPLIQFGPGGLTPCPIAYKAAMDRVGAAARTDLLWRVFVQLDDCPADIRQAATTRGAQARI